MKASQEIIYPTPGHSFCIQFFTERRLHFNWHYHHELELVIISDGHGQAHIGDMVISFRAPAAFLIGASMPHGFVSEDESRGWIIQFDTRVFRPHGGICELEGVSSLLSESGRGLSFSPGAADRAAEMLGGMESAVGLEIWTRVLKALDLFSGDSERTVCSRVRREAAPGSVGIDEIASEIFNNIGKSYRLQDMGRQAGLPVPTFCRHFKRRFGLSFTEYLHSIRVNNAKKLLIQTKLYIDDICYESGFNNVSFFNRKFKELTGMTPRVYRRLFSQSPLTAEPPPPSHTPAQAGSAGGAP